MMHDFELHEFFHSPKNVLLKALLYWEKKHKLKINNYLTEWIDITFEVKVERLN